MRRLISEREGERRREREGEEGREEGMLYCGVIVYHGRERGNLLYV